MCVDACLGVCLHKASPVIDEDKSGVGLPGAGWKAAVKTAQCDSLDSWCTAESCCKCMCCAHSLGLFRYNVLAAVYVWLLYLGQLRKASRATVTSLRSQQNSLRLVACWLLKLTLATKGNVVRKTWLSCSTMCLPKWDSSIVWQAGFLFGSVSSSFPSFVSFWVSIHTFVCGNMANSGLIWAIPDELPSATAQCKINSRHWPWWSCHSSEVTLSPFVIFVYFCLSLGQNEEIHQ